MFFLKSWPFFRRRPKPKFELGEFALIMPPPGTLRPITRYTVIRSRRWIKTDRQWVYGGPVIVTMADREGRAHSHIRHYVKSLNEDQLNEVRGGRQGL
jgi:hypothetical protein